MDALKVVGHAAVQTGVGAVTGGVVDTLMPEFRKHHGVPVDAMDALTLGVEAGAQIAADALVASLLSKGIRRMGRYDMGDPASGFAFILVLTATQPKLMEKMRLLGVYFHNLINEKPAEHSLPARDGPGGNTEQSYALLRKTLPGTF